MTRRAAVAAFLALVLGGGAMPRAQDVDGVRLLLLKFERIVQTGDGVAFMTALGATADRARARDFVSSELLPGSNRAVLQERDREPLPGALPGNGFRLMVDVLAEYGSRARAPPAPSRARARGAPRGDSTSAAPAPPAPTASGRSPTRSGCRRSRTSTASV